MSYQHKMRSNSGFSLVELMVVVVIMGLVTMAIFSLFQNVQNTGYTQDGVVDLQQNLRVGMDTLTKDIQMAGFLIPAANSAVNTAPVSLGTDPADTLVLQTATTSLDVARLEGEVEVDSTTPHTFTVATAEMLGPFSVNDKVRLIRSPDHGQKLDALFTVTSINTGTKAIGLDGFTGNASYQVVDLLVKTSSAHPASITYDLTDNTLRRTVSDIAGAHVVADNITAVDFMYRLENGTETSAPTSLADIRGIRVTITGTTMDLSSKGTKTRYLTKLITLKNNM